MGSEIGHLSMYYTEEEPPIDFIGRRRHYFGKPSLKGITGQNANRSNYGDPSTPTVPKDEALLRNAETLNSLRKIIGSEKDLRS
jgi:hypothetical protein